MSVEKLNRWADLLLDTGKRNNLVNFKDSKSSTVEVIVPDYATMVSRLAHSTTFEVFDPKIAEEDDFEEYSLPKETASQSDIEMQKNVGDDLGNIPIADSDSQKTFVQGETDNIYAEVDGTLSKSEYTQMYKRKLTKNQILVYNFSNKPMSALKYIKNRAKTFVEETGVNIAYLAIGFIKWTENENNSSYMRAPILLLPITIERQSSVTPFYIKIADDEVIVNPTFAFKLQNEFGITLPDYDLNDDIDSYFDELESMLSKMDWKIERDCKIGLFSFMKINMYKDIKDNADQIVCNKNIKILLGDYQQDSQEMWRGIANEGGYENLDLHNIVDADSSQMEAVEMARQGKSFVLQGPPGTGKSQTITNIIAESLHDGKKVLFVSEKLAALNVVYEKLQRAGLEEFCLELHSHKANKKAVIDELCKTLNASKIQLSKQAEEEQKSKKEEQQKLDNYTEQLHEKRAVINKSLFELISMLSGCNNAPNLEYIINKLSEKGEEYLDNAISLLENFVSYQMVVGYDYKRHIWYGYKENDSLQSQKFKLKTDYSQFVEVIKNLQNICKKISAKFDVQLDNLQNLHTQLDLFKFLGSCKFVSPAFIDVECIKTAQLVVKEQQTLSQNIKQLQSEINACYDEDIFSLNGKTIQKQLAKQYNSLFKRLFNKDYKKIIADLAMSSKGKKINYKTALQDISLLTDYQSNCAKFEECKSSIENILNDSYNGINTDFQAFIDEIDTWIVLCNKIKPEQNLQKFVQNIDAENKKFFASIALDLKGIFDSNCEFENSIASAFDKEMFDVQTEAFDVLANKLNNCLANMEQMFDWCGMYQLIGKLKQADLLSFVDLAIDLAIDSDQIVVAYKKVFLTQWIENVMYQSDIFTRLPRIHHDKSVEIFKEKDRLGFEINKATIKSELSGVRPSQNMVAPSGSIAKLMREGQKKRKQKSVRTLFAELSDLIQTLKPCLLMSPLSVSTFLSPNVDFDIVIFDEASQIFPQDAISVIYRGKQLVVVGDSKQMPPSKFFTAELVVDEDEEEEDVTDFESILDLCSVSLPQCRLKWHYRSKYEQLIAFSNKNFYDNTLVTFPSIKTMGGDIGVDYTYVDGIFDRKSKTNSLEAEKIVNMVFEHAKKYPNRSLGVVAFSISQQSLIERLISKRREADPSLEMFFSEEKPEPFFVKNLETVQGDERDTIIFSIAYAKDAQGKLLLNFGPLNRVGGERRLNVAVTRAKINLKVVTSMRHTDIDLSRVKSVGANMLYNYLYYAEVGSDEKQKTTNTNIYNVQDSTFEDEVCEFLQSNGYLADMHVGKSSFKIDIAVKKPSTNDYVLAVECDGETYRTSKTARDRDRLREDVLENMGWKFYRIWSVDWFRNKAVEQERLLQAVKNALDSCNESPEKEVLAEVNFEEEVIVKPFEFPKYKKVDEKKVFSNCKNNKFIQTIYTILQYESPISEEWLLKRICFMFGREKVTSVVLREYNYRMHGCERVGIIRKGGFVYLNGKEIPMLRVPKDGDTPREVKYIEPNELANGLLEVLRQNICVDKNGLFRMLAKQLGFARIGDTILECMTKALNLIADKIEVDGDMLSLKD